MRREKIFICFVLIAFFNHCGAQKNLDLEQAQYNATEQRWLFDQWDSRIASPTRKMQISSDSLTKYSGARSVLIESLDNAAAQADMGYLQQAIAADFEGRMFTFAAYVKSENITGSAALFVTIFKGKKILKSDYMSNRVIKGSNNWTQYYINMRIPEEEADSIKFGFFLNGNGRIWVDSVGLYLDGQSFVFDRRILKKKFKAESDSVWYRSDTIINATSYSNMEKSLADLGKIWGFLKYYHPAVAGGEFNWDNELFRILSRYLEITQPDKRSEFLVKWIQSLGNVPKCLSYSDDIVKSTRQIVDLSWINNTRKFSKELCELLNYIKENRFRGKQYYADVPYSSMLLRHEKEYLFDGYPPTHYRLLAIYRFWNLVEYWYPYKYLIKVNWDKILENSISEFISAKEKEAYARAVKKLVTTIHDSHSEIKGIESLQTKVYYPPFAFQFIQKKLIVSRIVDPNLLTGTEIEIGDNILSIDEKPITKILDSLRVITPHSNEGAFLRKAQGILMATNQTYLKVRVNRGNKQFSSVVKTTIPKNLSDYYYQDFSHMDSSFCLIREDIVYLNAGRFKRKDIPELKRLLMSAKGLIIDNRQYPVDLYVDELCGLLFPSRMAVARFVMSDIDFPGNFKWADSTVSSFGIQGNSNYFKGSVIILVNSSTISQGEYYAMAFRKSPNSIVVGSPTAGALGINNTFSLPGGINTSFTGDAIYYPNGQTPQGSGIIPDVVVYPTVLGVKAKKDEVLLKGIELIDKPR